MSQSTAGQHFTCTMKWSVDNLHVSPVFFDQFRVDGQVFELLKVLDISLFAQHFDDSRCLTFFQISQFDGKWIVNGTDVVSQGAGISRGHLSAIFTVNLVSVKFFGVVAGSHHDTCDGIVVTHGKGEFWRWTEAFKDIGLNAMGSQNLC